MVVVVVAVAVICMGAVAVICMGVVAVICMAVVAVICMGRMGAKRTPPAAGQEALLIVSGAPIQITATLLL